MTPLTDDEIVMLDLERCWWQRTGTKDSQVRERLGVSSTAYYLRLNALIDRPEAEAHDPLVVRRLRAARYKQRSSRARHPAGSRLGREDTRPG